MAAVGIDVGKTNLDVAVEGRQGVTRYANTRSGIAKLVKWLRGLEPPRESRRLVGVSHAAMASSRCC